MPSIIKPTKHHNNNAISHNLGENKAKKDAKLTVHKTFPNQHQLLKVLLLSDFW
jgi:hypothetical protein